MTKCPYCNASPLRIAMTAQYIDEVDPAIVDLTLDNMERQKAMAKNMKGFMGGMMAMSAGMGTTKGMKKMMANMAEAQVQYPPLVTILKCMSCDAALSIKLVGGYGQGSS